MTTLRELSLEATSDRLEITVESFSKGVTKDAFREAVTFDTWEAVWGDPSLAFSLAIRACTVEVPLIKREYYD